MPSCLRPLFALLVLAATLTGPASAAADFPNRTVRIVVGFAPGGTTDLLARILADQLRAIWKTSVVVENRPGADGIIATTAVHHAPADGYTLLMSTNAMVITPHLKPLPYDPIKDFEPITIVGREYHHMMVTPKLPAKTVKEFIDLAKSTPGGLTFSSAGPGSAPFLGMQRFLQAAGISKMVHVPYPGSMPAVMALVTGTFSRCSRHRRPRCRSYATARSGCWRLPGRRATPTRRTHRRWSSPGFRDLKATLGSRLMASSKVPADVLDKVRADVGRAMQDPVAIKRIKDIKSVPVGNTAEEFRQVIKDDLETFRRVISSAK